MTSVDAFTERTGNKRRALLALLSILGILAAAEGVAYLVVENVLEARLIYHWRSDPEQAINRLTDEQIRRFREEVFDPEIGWVYREATKQLRYTSFYESGARRNPVATRKVRIAAYGDSFTFGQDAEDDGTWPYYLSLLTDSHVLNFGVKRYTPIQSLMRLRRHVKRGDAAEVIIWSMVSESIGPLLGTHRHAYLNVSPATEFLPTLAATDGQTQWIPSPLKAANERSDFLAAVESGRGDDFWYAYNRTRPKSEFPYLLSVLDVIHYLAVRVLRWQDVWEMPAARSHLRLAVDAFVGLSREHGFTPVFLMLPMGVDLRHHESGQLATYATFLEELRAAHGNKLIIVDLLEEDFDIPKLNLWPYVGHHSAYGNQVTARALEKRIAPLLGAPGSSRQ